MQHMLEQTQLHLSQLGVKKPVHLDHDKRHTESAEYPFMEYDVLKDDDEADTCGEYIFHLRGNSILIF
jgi:hypothetical protein